MVYLLSVQGNAASSHSIDSSSIENFKSIVRGLTSGSVFVISSPHKTDVFYHSDEEKDEAIIKIWSLYSKEPLAFDHSSIKRVAGEENVFVFFFQSLVSLSENWHWNKTYQDIFLESYLSDVNNLIANKILDCDRFLLDQKSESINREPLMDQNKFRPSNLMSRPDDTCLVAMSQLSKLSDN